MEIASIIIIAILCAYLIYQNNRLTNQYFIALDMIKDLVEELIKGDNRLEERDDI